MRHYRFEIAIIVFVMLAINAGVFLYAWNKAQGTANIACDASALVSHQVQDIYNRNIHTTYPQLYRDDQISIQGLNTLTKNATTAIHNLDDAERKCLHAVGKKDTFFESIQPD